MLESLHESTAWKINMQMMYACTYQLQIVWDTKDNVVQLIRWDRVWPEDWLKEFVESVRHG